MSPRRNARALTLRPKRHAASGKTRALGQHFLRDDAVAERMVGLVNPTGRVVVVGNLPYSVGKPILQALVEAGPALDEMALMLQKEVAERVAAAPGGKTYGSLSVLTQLACEARLAFTVPPGAFTPPPQVHSAVLH